MSVRNRYIYARIKDIRNRVAQSLDQARYSQAKQNYKEANLILRDAMFYIESNLEDMLLKD